MGWKRKKSEGVQVMKGGKRMGNLMDIGKIPSLKRLVYDNLKERIISGELKPGTRLREEDLSVEMNISGRRYVKLLICWKGTALPVICSKKRNAVVAEADRGRTGLYLGDARNFGAICRSKIHVVDF